MFVPKERRLNNPRGREVSDDADQASPFQRCKSAPKDSLVSYIALYASLIATYNGGIAGVATLWSEFVKELRLCWIDLEEPEHVPVEDAPDMRHCLIFQKIQMLKCCITRQEQRNALVTNATPSKRKSSVQASRLQMTNYKSKWHNIWIRDVICYWIPAPLLPGVPTKTRLESSMKKFNPHAMCWCRCPRVRGSSHPPATRMIVAATSSLRTKRCRTLTPG